MGDEKSNACRIGDRDLKLAIKTDNTSKKASTISVKDFLDFLKTAYQVQEAIDGTVPNVPIKSVINWGKLANNNLVSSINANSLSNHKSEVCSEKETIGATEAGNKIGDCNDNGNTESKLSESSEKYKHERKLSVDKRSHLIFRRKSLTGRRELLTSFTGQTKTHCTEVQKELESVIKHKLTEVLNEGILDSVLPYVVPVASSQSIGSFSVRDAISKHLIQNHTFRKDSIRKPTASASEGSLLTGQGKNRRRSSTALDVKSIDSEVEIHVCDEVKGVTKDFKCPQKLLVSQMGYFADVQSGQKLEDMDISVHCDIRIFDWLMKWVKRESVPMEEWPTLDPGNVIPILVSASFLQMEPLVQDCLMFCHSNLNEVIRSSANLACLNDNIISRLAAMYTNTELEAVKDKKDRIQSRLFCKLILSLAEPEPQSLRGHFCGLQGMYKCSKCNRLVLQFLAHIIPCDSHNMRVDKFGCLISQHTRDTGWNISSQIIAWHKELRSWRKVYWRLWGSCHYLHCTCCQTLFPVSQMGWCQYHSEFPQYPGNTQAQGPVGRYPCCGQKAFRYETLHRQSGCIYRDHVVEPMNERDTAILQLYDNFSFVISQTPPEIIPKVEATWWAGLSLAQPKSKGLVPIFHENVPDSTNSKRIPVKAPIIPSDTDSDNDRQIFRLESSSEGEGESEGSVHRPVRRGRGHKKNAPRANYGLWSGELSARSNQDNQREYEERAMRQLISLLGRRSGVDSKHLHAPQWPQGGTYVKLEHEWREAQSQCPAKQRGRKDQKKNVEQKR